MRKSNAATHFGGAAPTANGDLETKTDSATSAITASQYDAFGNLTRVDLPNGDVVQYLVDGMNRREQYGYPYYDQGELASRTP
jgi:YD repeat-containing protein